MKNYLKILINHFNGINSNNWCNTGIWQICILQRSWESLLMLFVITELSNSLADFWQLRGFIMLRYLFRKGSKSYDLAGWYSVAIIMMSWHENAFCITGPLWQETTTGFHSRGAVMRGIWYLLCGQMDTAGFYCICKTRQRSLRYK